MKHRIDLKLLTAGASALILFLCLLTFYFGVSPLITATILLCFLIILITAVGCSIHIREIERLEEAEGFQLMKEKVEHHMAFINEVLAPAKERLLQNEQQIGQTPGTLDGSIKNLSSARRILNALENRLDELVKLSVDAKPEGILKAHEICESLLVVSENVMETVIDADHIPALESHLWRDTLDMLLIQIERQIREKTGAAA